ncbi:hypothetical protein CVO96_09975 [Deinococcus koreensis]|uniref:Uncharacterized protein n=2 Tax=Deinococcus koreensis TaxID=2054903 RepID=A0A2K3UYQ6_9DEIO|nr:hypothetical protein CVO96_09975 [Deinococcus koreensis]
MGTLDFDLPTTYEVQVLRAPTGSKKSRLSREKIAQAFKSGALKRVIWAVHSTLKNDSLAFEASQHFKEVGVDAVTLAAWDDTKPRKYHAQLAWPQTPQVKIVSFAHLPFIYGRSQTLRKLDAELLVIDELPMTGLVHPARMSIKEMGQIASCGGGPLALRLIGLMSKRLDQPDSAFTEDLAADPRGITRRRYFTGKDFLQSVGNGLTDADWDAFGQALDGFKPFTDQMWFTSEWLAAFRADVEAGQDSGRFGLTWAVRNGVLTEPPVFYSSTLTPLADLPPTLVLDAYADPGLYQALFPNQQVRLIDRGRNPPLQIELAPELKLYRLHMGRESANCHRRHIAEEILLLHRDSGLKVVLLVDKAFRKSGSPWQLALTEASRHLGIPVPPALHHFAGRGKNEFDGHLVVALSLAALPNSHHVIDLAALYPYSPARRKAMHRALMRAERLQMYNRGRQPTSGQRIISAFDPELPKHQCITSLYKPALPFTKQSDNPRWEHAMQVVTRELVTALGGVPRAFLGVLGLIRVNFGKGEKAAAHSQALRAAVRASTLQPDSQLAQWLHLDYLPSFRDVKPYRKKDGRVTDVLNGFHLATSGYQHDFPYQQERIKTQIWVPADGDELAVLRRAYPG